MIKLGTVNIDTLKVGSLSVSKIYLGTTQVYPRELSSISVTGQSTVFAQNAAFVFNGTVLAVYTDNTTEDVTSQASVTTPDTSTLGTKTVTVSYSGLSTTYEITVVQYVDADNIVATYNITSSNVNRQIDILNSGFNSSTNIINMYVDDALITPSNTYTFTSTGNHIVRCKMKWDSEHYSDGYQSMFEGITTLTAVEIKDVNVGKYMFRNCTRLASVNFLGRITVLNNSCFENTRIKNVILPDSIWHINVSAFKNSPVELVIIGEDIALISTDAFYNEGNTTYLKTIYCKSTTAPTINYLTFRLSDNNEGYPSSGYRNLYYPIGSASSYSSWLSGDAHYLGEAHFTNYEYGFTSPTVTGDSTLNNSDNYAIYTCSIKGSNLPLVRWSIVSGSEYATLTTIYDGSDGYIPRARLDALQGASNNNVIIRATGYYNDEVYIEKTVAVTYQEYFTITANATNGIVTGGGSYLNGSTATLEVTPNSGYFFEEWSDGNTNNPRTITVSGDATYSTTCTAIVPIRIDVLEDINDYSIGDTFTFAGVVNLVYNNGAIEDVTNSCTFSNPDMTTTGFKTVTVTYGNFTDEYIIEVHTITLTLSGQTTSYSVGDTFSFDGTVTATYWDETEEDVTSECTFSSPDMSSAGNKTVTVTFGLVSTTYQITVVAAPTLQSITLSGQTTTFQVNDTFTFDGTVTAHYSDSSSADVTNSTTFSSPDMTSAGTKTVTATYLTVSTTYNITVEAVEAYVETTVDVIQSHSSNKLISSLTGVTKMYLDGVEITPVTTRQLSVGEHTVRTVFENNAIPEDAYNYCIGSYYQSGSQLTSYIKNLVISEGIVSIGLNAFKDCANKYNGVRYSISGNLVIPSTITSIDLNYVAINRLCNPFGQSHFSSITSNNTRYKAENNCLYDSNTGKAIAVADTTVVTIPEEVTSTVSNLIDYHTNTTTVVLPSTITSLAQFTITNTNTVNTIYCYATTAPTLYSYMQSYNVYYESWTGLASGGKLFYPAGSDYSTWLGSSAYLLGYYNWTGVPIDIVATYNVTSTSSATNLFNSIHDTSIDNMYIDGTFVSKAASYTFNTTGEHIVAYKVNSTANWFLSGDYPIVRLYMGGSLTSLGMTSPYSGVSQLQSVVMGDNITTIDSYSFGSNPNLSYVKLSNSLTALPTSAFSSCTSLTNIVIPDTVTTIGINAFTKSGLITITIPSSVTSIDSSAFSNNVLTSFTVDSNNSNYSSDGGVLFNKDKTELVSYPTNKSGNYTIPNSVTQLNNYSLYYYKGTSITIGDSVTTILGSALRYARNITSINIGNAVTSIGAYAFNNGTTGANYTVTITAVNPPTIKANVFNSSKITAIYVPSASVATYQSESGWSDYSSIIQAIPS